MGISDTDPANCDDVLRVVVSGPDMPNLTLVDLPGLYYSTIGQQGTKVIPSLTEKYMKNSRSIILAVISARTTHHLQGVLDAVKPFDPKLERTLGIITHPDLLETHSENEDNCIQLIRNEKATLNLGWHALRNASDEVCDGTEMAFFEQGRWASVSRYRVGINALRLRLKKVFLQFIGRGLPGLIADIQVKASEWQQKLSKLGVARSTLQQQRGFLLGVSSGFERITSQALSGMYADPFFGGLDAGTPNGSENFRRLRAVIRELNEHFAEAMSIRGSRRMITISPEFANYQERSTEEESNLYLRNWMPIFVSRELLEQEMREQSHRSRGIELSFTANQLIVGALFRDQSAPWEDLARMHLINTWESAKYFACLALQHLVDESTYSLLFETVLEPELEKIKRSLLEKLGELAAHTKRGHPLPIGKGFLDKIQKSRTGRQLAALKNELGLTSALFQPRDAPGRSIGVRDLERAASGLQSSSDEFAAAEIIDQMQAYYDTAIVTFVDNVATLGIESCLLSPLEHIFTTRLVNNMDDEQIRNLAAESPQNSIDRENLTQELEKLQAIVRDLNALSASNFKTAPQPPAFGELFSSSSTPSSSSAVVNYPVQIPGNFGPNNTFGTNAASGGWPGFNRGLFGPANGSGFDRNNALFGSGLSSWNSSFPGSGSQFGGETAGGTNAPLNESTDSTRTPATRDFNT